VDDKYFIIDIKDDDISFSVVSNKEDMLKLINEDYKGDTVKFLSITDEQDTDFNYWDTGVYIIKGKSIVPKEVKVVKELIID